MDLTVSWQRRWLAHLPEPLKRAGAPHSQCCLFWHPTAAEDGWETVSMWRRWKASSFGRSVRLAVKVSVPCNQAFRRFCMHLPDGEYCRQGTSQQFLLGGVTYVSLRQPIAILWAS